MPDEGRSTSTHAARRIDPAGLTGAWVNTESSPRGVARVVIERRPDALGIWALGADDQTHEGWGWTDAEALYAASASGDDAVAFTAAYTVESMPVALHANVSKGLLIVSSFQTRFDAGHSEARFAREFFRRANSELLKPLKVPGKQSAARPVAPSSSASTFVGIWRNTNSEAVRHRFGLVRGHGSRLRQCESWHGTTPACATGGRPPSRSTPRSGPRPSPPRSRPAMISD